MHCGLDLAIPATSGSNTGFRVAEKNPTALTSPRRSGSANRSGGFSPAMLHIGRRIRPASGQSATNSFISGQFHSSDSTPPASTSEAHFLLPLPLRERARVDRGNTIR
jgi:hypothetical protein